MASARAKLIPMLLTAAFGAAVPTATPGQSSELHGRVVSAAGAPIAGATITLVGFRYSIKSDSLGQFRFAGPPGSTLPLSLQADGFRDDTASVVLTRRRSVVRDFVLVSGQTPLPEANPCDRVLRGRVTTAEGDPQNVTDAVRHFPNIRLSPIDDGKVVFAGGTPMTPADGMPLARKFRIEDSGGCPMTVFLVRQRIQPSIVGLRAVDEEINTIVQPHSVAGIEVYPRVTGAPSRIRCDGRDLWRGADLDQVDSRPGREK